MSKTIVAIFFILHGLTHGIMALVPNPNDPDQGVATFFSGVGSWLLTRLSKAASQKLAILLALIALLGFVAASAEIQKAARPQSSKNNVAVS